MPRPRRADAVAGTGTGTGTATDGRRPPARVVLRALREGRGVSQDGWAALLGYGTTTVRRWEAGTAAPTAEAETAIVAVCEGRGLFRRYDTGPLRGLTLTPDLLRDVLAEARIAASDARRTPPVAVAAGERPPPVSSAPADDTSVLPPSNLPAALTSFVGREGALAAIRRLLVTPVGAGGTRLLTLTGAGGCGKTRLALALATALHAEREESGPRYPDGVWLVELAALPAERPGSGGDEAGHQQAGDAAPARLSLLGADLVTRTVAATLGVREQSGRSLLASLVEYLQERRLLLVVDNCEHLVASSAALIEAVLRAGPGVQVLATSREVLRVAGEAVFRVPSLAVPATARGATPNGGISAEVRAVESVQLFVQRATAAASEWSLTEDDQGAVAEICRRLDGIPLALELAAARVRTLSVEQIARRLDDRFRLLVGGSRTALPRQQTLRACIDWSHDLLPAAEQILFRRLAVFAGGFDLDAAEAICGGEGIDPDDAFDLLVALVEKSMVIAEGRGDAARYRLLETIRAYAQERLTSTGDHPLYGAPAPTEYEDVQSRHAGWYGRVAAQADAGLQGAAQRTSLERLDVERDNIRTALMWNVDRDRVGDAMAVANALSSYWAVRGRLSEGQAWFERLMAHPARVPAPLRMRGALSAGALFLQAGNLPTARTYLQETLELAREAGESGYVASALQNLAVVAHREGDFAVTRLYTLEAIEHFRRLGDRRRVAGLLNNLSMALHGTGDIDEARERLDEAMALAHDVGDQLLVAGILRNLGDNALRRLEFTEARQHYERALDINREFGNQTYVANSLNALAGLATQMQAFGDARRFVDESLAIRRSIDDQFGLMHSLLVRAQIGLGTDDTTMLREASAEALEIALTINANDAVLQAVWLHACVAQRCGRRLQAARLCGAVAFLRETLNIPFGAKRQADFDAMVAEMQRATAPEQFTAAWREGSAMSFAATAQYAGQIDPDPGHAAVVDRAADAPAQRPQPTSPPDAVSLPDGLSAREAEVLAMLAAGLQTREIAARLVVSARTVEHHIGGIYRKINARNRADAAAYALRHGLVREPGSGNREPDTGR